MNKFLKTITAAVWIGPGEIVQLEEVETNRWGGHRLRRVEGCEAQPSVLRKAVGKAPQDGQ